MMKWTTTANHDIERVRERARELAALRGTPLIAAAPEMAELLEKMADVVDAAQRLCEVYFDIAATCMSEDEIRAMRDRMMTEKKSVVGKE